MRAVLDTNVVISALIWGGTPFSLLQAATEGNIVLVTSPALLKELREVLARPHLSAKLHQHGSSIVKALELYGQLAVLVTPSSAPRVVQDDADDDHVVAAAVAGHVDLIVSGDRHLLSLTSHLGIPIVTPSHAVKMIVR